jgi:hypothetical protein
MLRASEETDTTQDDVQNWLGLSWMNETVDFSFLSLHTFN